MTRLWFVGVCRGDEGPAATLRRCIYTEAGHRTSEIAAVPLKGWAAYNRAGMVVFSLGRGPIRYASVPESWLTKVCSPSKTLTKSLP